MQQIKYLLATVAVLAALGYGLPKMLMAESHINLNSEEINNPVRINQMVTEGLSPYFWAIGAVFALAGIAIVLADGEEKISTLRGTGDDEL